MDDVTRDALAGQVGAALDMLGAAIDACPDTAWADREHPPAFGDLAFHVLFWFDLYLADDPARYAPPAPFGLEERDPAGVLPPRVYSKAELTAYLAHGRAGLRTRLEVLRREPAAAARTVSSGHLELPMLELLLYNLRHLHHHVGQLQAQLRRAGVEPPRWVRRGGS